MFKNLLDLLEEMKLQGPTLFFTLTISHIFACGNSYKCCTPLLHFRLHLLFLLSDMG